jgi:hypothetical protein
MLAVEQRTSIVLVLPLEIFVCPVIVVIVLKIVIMMITILTIIIIIIIMSEFVPRALFEDSKENKNQDQHCPITDTKRR